MEYLHALQRTGSIAVFLLMGLCASVWAQQPVILAPQPAVNNAVSDTFRMIEIVRGNSLREKVVDSATSLQTIAGNVELHEGLTIFTCDSATINKRTNVVEAFGNVHINQHDSIFTWAQYLKYVGNEQKAYLKKNVKLTDRKGVLYTDELEYDMKTNIGIYRNGGRVVNGKTVLTSREGTYFADTRDVFFKHDVKLTDPQYDIRSDSLRYNTEFQQATFITDTYIRTKDGAEIFTRSGNYDLKNRKAYFADRTVFKDSTRTYTANQSAFDEASGTAQLEGNAVVRDSTNGYMVTGNQIFLNKNNNSFLATRKPVLIFKGEGSDSTFIAADTLFSGVMKADSVGKLTLLHSDTLKTTQVQAPDSSRQVLLTDVEQFDPQKTDSIRAQTNLKLPASDTARHSDSTIRFFQAFHHVRIFNDSIQAVCDSLYYSSADSVFRMFNDPLVFARGSQISGDTIHLYTRNKKAHRIHVFDQGMIINRLNSKFYNQVAGRTMNGYFINGDLDYMRVKGFPAESIFYPQDDDSAFTGMNRCSGDLIDVYFVNKEINKVKFVNEVDGILYPIRQIPADKKELTGFRWLDHRRPKNRLELFE